MLGSKERLYREATEFFLEEARSGFSVRCSRRASTHARACEASRFGGDRAYARGLAARVHDLPALEPIKRLISVPLRVT